MIPPFVTVVTTALQLTPGTGVPYCSTCNADDKTHEGAIDGSQPASPVATKDTGFPAESAAEEQSLFQQVAALHMKVLSKTEGRDLEADNPSIHSVLNEFSALGKGELTDEILGTWQDKFESILKELDSDPSHALTSATSSDEDDDQPSGSTTWF